MKFSESKGIFQQIAERISIRILQKEWLGGERIPSIRELAVELGVNPNTITKSYQSLLDKGIILNQRGKGYFVSETATKNIINEMKTEFINDELPRIVRTMTLLHIDEKELVRLLNRHKTQPEQVENKHENQ